MTLFNSQKRLALTAWVVFVLVSALACNALSGGGDSPSNDPPATAAPSGNGNPSNSSDTTSPTIASIKSGTSIAYFGNNTCGPTTLRVNVTASDDSGSLASVSISYRYLGGGANAIGEFVEKTLSSVGGDSYTISIDVDTEASALLGSGEGELEYQIYARDAAGNVESEPEGNLYGIVIKNCTQAPVSAGDDTSSPTIANVAQSPPAAYYNGSCGPTTATISASITDNSGVLKRAWVMYRYNGFSATTVGDWNEADMAVSGDSYTATIDVGGQANRTMQGNDGVLEYQIFAEDVDGNSTSDPDGSIYGLEVYSCGQPNSGNNGSGGSTPIELVFNYVNGTENALYYGSCADEPTILSVQTSVTPLDDVLDVFLSYQYSDNQGDYGINAEQMSQVGVGDFVADIDVAVSGDQALGGGAGELAYWIEAIDTDGTYWISATFTASVDVCQNGGGNNSGSGSSGVGPIFGPGISFFTGPGKGSPGQTYSVSWETFDATCGVFLDGSSINDVGTMQLIVPLDAPIDSTITHTLLTEAGDDCANPESQEAYIYIFVENPKALVTNWGSTTNYCCGLDLDSNHGAVDLLFSYHSDGSYSLWSDSGTTLALYPGVGEPNVSDCFGIPDSSLVYLSEPISDYYYCFLTSEGHYGYFYPTKLVLVLGTGNQNEWETELFYFTESD